MKKYLIICIVVVSIIIIFLIGFFIMNKNKKSGELSNIKLEPGEFLFRGRISNIDLSCNVDGTCSMTIGGRWVVWGTDTRGKPKMEVGQLIGFDFQNNDKKIYINKEAEVYGTTNDAYGFTSSIYGKKDYYIKLLGK